MLQKNESQAGNIAAAARIVIRPVAADSLEMRVREETSISRIGWGVEVSISMFKRLNKHPQKHSGRNTHPRKPAFPGFVG